jgi:hypothetical protein
MRRFEAALPAVSDFRTSLAESAKSRTPPREVFSYRILRRTAENEFREAQRGALFDPGDSVVISVDMAQDGSLQLYEGTTALSPLLPVQAGQRYTLPAQGAIELTGDVKERTLTLRIILSTFPEPVSLPITLKMRQ